MPDVLQLIRHGAIVPADDHAYYGRTDRPLTAAGIAQARAIGAYMSPARPDQVLCSPLSRALQTAELAGFPDPVIWDELREIDFGDWEGRTFSDIAASDPDRVQQWHDDEATFRFPGGESIREFRSRLVAAARRIGEMEAGTVAVFAHGGIVRTLLCHFLGLPLDRYLLFSIKPGAVATLRLYDACGVLTELLTPGEGLPAWDGSS